MEDGSNHKISNSDGKDHVWSDGKSELQAGSNIDVVCLELGMLLLVDKAQE